MKAELGRLAAVARRGTVRLWLWELNSLDVRQWDWPTSPAPPPRIRPTK